MSKDPPTIWIQPETYERMKQAKPEAMTFDELVTVALNKLGIEKSKQLQME